ncbi:MAG: hypothetical protein QNJ22_01870 [Desulfosarcinaceae bacterium]|nr:hypothetical protein [Desulfosarcinaceae bacterium]
MADNLIPIDDTLGGLAEELQKLMKLVDPHQRDDKELARLLLIRLKIDGLERTRAYLVEKTRAADACGYTGRLYDYLKDDTEARSCQGEGS